MRLKGNVIQSYPMPSTLSHLLLLLEMVRIDVIILYVP